MAKSTPERSLRSESQQSATSSSISEASTPASQPATPPPPRRVTLAQPHSARPPGASDQEWAQPIVEEPPTALTAPQHFALPRQLQPTPQERFLKVLVVGRKGLGKTTWISNMQAIYGSSEELAAANYQPDDKEAHAAGEDIEMRNFLKDPCHLLTEMTLRDDRSHVTHHICIQDTPGYSKEVPVKHVTSYIRQQHKHFFDMEQSSRRRVPVSALPDTRVDVCIFFLPSSSLRSHDMAALSEIGALVPIVPVVGKADVLDPDELRKVRKRVTSALDMIRVNDNLECRHTFPAEDIAATGAPSSQIFSIIAGNVLEDFEGRKWPARKYTWGKCETLLPENSDVLALSRLLFELSLPDTKNKTEKRYLDLRQRSLRIKSKRKEIEVASKMQQMEKNQQEHVEKLAAKVQGMQVRVLQDARKHEQQLLKKQHKLAGASPPERNKSGSSKGQ